MGVRTGFTAPSGLVHAAAAPKRSGCTCLDDQAELSERERRMLTILRQLEEEDRDALFRVAERMLPPATVHRPPGEPINEN